MKQIKKKRRTRKSDRTRYRGEEREKVKEKEVGDAVKSGKRLGSSFSDFLTSVVSIAFEEGNVVVIAAVLVASTATSIVEGGVRVEAVTVFVVTCDGGSVAVSVEAVVLLMG